ncbi:MAG: hypothetical protein WCV83_02240 [Candidatus Magasanikbacteria bacterium]|jgi:hypothetical protein
MDENAGKKLETNMYAWGKALGSVDTPDKNRVDNVRELSNALGASRFSGWDRIQKLGLPNDVPRICSLEHLLNSPEEILPEVGDSDWFVLLEPKKKDGMRYRKTPLKREEILEFVKSTINQHELNVGDYDVSIVEMRPQKYGGNIIVDPKGRILAEISSGGQGVVADGTHDVKKHGEMFVARRDELSGLFKYSWEDGEATDGVPLRELVYKTIMNIPHEGEGRDLKFLPGYYEFKLVDKRREDGLEPVFIDCRNGSSLLNLPE